MRLFVLACLACLAAAFSAAAEKSGGPKRHTLSEFMLGQPVLGRGSLADAKGKAAVIEAWGVRCPPCIASLPKLQALSERHRDKVLFFGAESQGHDRQAIEPVIKKAGVTFPISAGLAKCPIEFNALPRAFVFDASGKLIFNGNPNGKAFADAVEKAAASVAAR